MEMAAGALDEGKLLGAACRSLSETGPWPKSKGGGWRAVCERGGEHWKEAVLWGRSFQMRRRMVAAGGWILEGSGTSGIGKDNCHTGQKKSTAEATWKAVEQPLQVHV
jgi:hypothetical protein